MKKLFDNFDYHALFQLYHEKGMRFMAIDFCEWCMYNHSYSHATRHGSNVEESNVINESMLAHIILQVPFLENGLPFDSPQETQLYLVLGTFLNYKC